MKSTQELYEKLITERQPHLDKLNAARDERDAGYTDGTLTVARDAELVAEIKKQSAVVFPFDMEIGKLARALGAKSLHDKK
jgi:hypothetical protein